MKRTQEAVALHDSGFSCSQAVLTVFAEELGLSNKIAKKISTAFGGGIIGSKETCGVITGALMVIGLKHGRFSVEDMAAKERTYQLSELFFQRFIDRYNSLLCKDLRIEDRGTPEKKHFAQETCNNYIREAVLLLEEIL